MSEPIPKLADLGFVKVPEDIEPAELHAVVTVMAFNNFHLSGAVPELARVEMYLSPTEIEEGFGRAIIRFAEEHGRYRHLLLDSVLRSAANASHPDGSYWWYWLALIYSTAKIVAADPLKSAHYHQMAAEAGYPSAAMMLGYFKESSEKIDEAFWWYSIAAECGWKWAAGRADQLGKKIAPDVRAQVVRKAEATIKAWDISCVCRYVQGKEAQLKYYCARIDKESG